MGVSLGSRSTPLPEPQTISGTNCCRRFYTRETGRTHFRLRIPGCGSVPDVPDVRAAFTLV
jgi:hypothetical protein